jgi:uncharacterized membrane protein
LPRLLLTIYLFGLIGVFIELLLLEHFEDWRQVIPLGLIVLGVVTGVRHARSSAASRDRVFPATLALMAASGLLGQILHFRGNWEFEVESDATLGTWQLFADSMMGATPTLAPGTMLLLAAIGYAYKRSRAERVERRG